jgi:glycosyltransferase involved in cell wall biosynthesis
MPHDVGANVFIPEIARGYTEAGCDVVVGRENLAHLMTRPAIIHLHWPEEHFAWGEDARSPQMRATTFLKRLDELLRQGATLVWEVHNLRPHETRVADLEQAVYQAVIDRAHILVHHCETSIGLLKERYEVSDNVRMIVSPLGNYSAYPNTTDKASSRTRLKIAPDRFVYLHFGAIRAYKGLDLLLQAYSGVKARNKFLLVAGRYAQGDATSRALDRLRFAIRKRLANDVRFDLRLVPEEEIQHYFNAADVVVLAHRAGLNSAIAVLGMTFGRMVIGPDCGCISSVLQAGDNIVYQTGDVAQLTSAMQRSLSMNVDAAGARNRAAAAEWEWRRIARAVLRDYEPRTDAQSSPEERSFVRPDELRIAVHRQPRENPDTIPRCPTSTSPSRSLPKSSPPR